MRRRIAKTIAALLAAASLAGAAAAQSPEEGAPIGDFTPSLGERIIPEEEWLSMVEDRTVYYEIAGNYHGKEYYEPGSNRVVFVFASGECSEGAWRQQNGVYCFDYGSIYCFYHFERDGQTFIRDVERGGEQRVAQITNEALSCQPEIISRADPSDALRRLVAAPSEPKGDAR